VKYTFPLFFGLYRSCHRRRQLPCLPTHRLLLAPPCPFLRLQLHQMEARSCNSIV